MYGKDSFLRDLMDSTSQENLQVLHTFRVQGHRMCNETFKNYYYKRGFFGKDYKMKVSNSYLIKIHSNNCFENWIAKMG